ncbi:hypothetical protein THRCLA_11965, partial [Thraustotheca clavata]
MLPPFEAEMPQVAIETTSNEGRKLAPKVECAQESPQKCLDLLAPQNKTVECKTPDVEIEPVLPHYDAATNDHSENIMHQEYSNTSQLSNQENCSGNAFDEPNLPYSELQLKPSLSSITLPPSDAPTSNSKVIRATKPEESVKDSAPQQEQPMIESATNSNLIREEPKTIASIAPTLKEADNVKPDIHLEWKKMFELRYEEEIPVKKRVAQVTVPRKGVTKPQPVKVQKKHIEGHVERMRKAHEIAIARELQEHQREKNILQPKKKSIQSPNMHSKTPKAVKKASPTKSQSYAQPTKSRLQKAFQAQEPSKEPTVVDHVKETKKSFMKNALEEALQGMTNTMHNNVTSESSNNACQNVKAMWLLESELNGVVDAFLSSTAEESKLIDDAPDTQSPEEMIAQKSFNCHLCMVEMAAHWCCDCTTALCATCLADVGCQLEHHQVERIMPHNQSAIVLNKETESDIAINPKANIKATFFREKTWIRLPLQFCSELSSALASTKMQRASPKILKQFCLVLRKQIELSPTSKTVSAFLDRSRVSDWSADQLRCFLDVVHVTSTILFKHHIDGPAFLKLPPAALHDTFLIHGSFQLHRCLFYRSLLVEMESYRTHNNLPNNLCTSTTTKKPKQKMQNISKPKLKQATKVSNSITTQPLPTQKEKHEVKNHIKAKPVAIT